MPRKELFLDSGIWQRSFHLGIDCRSSSDIARLIPPLPSIENSARTAPHWQFRAMMAKSSHICSPSCLMLPSWSHNAFSYRNLTVHVNLVAEGKTVERSPAENPPT